MVRRERLLNSISTTLSGTVTAGATTITVASATGFPTEGDFRLLVGGVEIMLVTAVSGTTFTVVRGADNSVSTAHADAVAVEAYMTVGAITQYMRDRDPWVNARPAYRIQDASGDLLTSSDFTQINFVFSAAASDSDGNIMLSKNDHGTTNVTALVRSAPSTPYSITAAVRVQLFSDFSLNGPLAGCCFRESSSGNLITQNVQPSNNRAFRIIYRASPTGGGTTLIETEPTVYKQPVWFRFEDDGTDLTWYISFDGVNWQFQDTEARGLRFTTGPDQIGICINNDDGIDANFVSLLAWEGE